VTTWLEFRSEPLSDVPEVIWEWKVKSLSVTELHVECEVCGVIETDADFDEVDDLIAAHQKWHEDGMPE
jgi:hypothetical protein